MILVHFHLNDNRQRIFSHKSTYSLNFVLIDRAILTIELSLFYTFAAPGSLAQFITIGEARFFVSNGYRYYKNNGHNGSVYWLCQGYQRYGCSARAITKNDKIKSTKGSHNHPAPFDLFQ